MAPYSFIAARADDASFSKVICTDTKMHVL